MITFVAFAPGKRGDEAAWRLCTFEKEIPESKVLPVGTEVQIGGVTFVRVGQPRRLGRHMVHDLEPAHATQAMTIDVPRSGDLAYVLPIPADAKKFTAFKRRLRVAGYKGVIGLVLPGKPFSRRPSR